MGYVWASEIAEIHLFLRIFGKKGLKCLRWDMDINNINDIYNIYIYISWVHHSIMRILKHNTWRSDKPPPSGDFMAQ